jgi:intein/homing endonuclease
MCPSGDSGYHLYYNPVKSVFFCLPPYSLVRLARGFFPIEQVKIGDKVISSDGFLSNVIDIWSSNSSKPLVRVVLEKMSGLPLECTIDHPIFCIRDGVEQYVEAGKLRESDYVCLSHFCHIKDLEEIQIESSRSRLYKDSLGTEYATKEGDTQKRIIKVSNDFMYFLGLWLGGGFSAKGNEIGICTSQENVDLISCLAKKVLGKSSITTGNGALCVHVCDTFISRFFVNHFRDCNGGKFIPIWISQLPIEKLRHLLAGLIDSDGSSQNEGRFVSLQQTEKNKQFLFAAFEIFQKCGVPVSLQFVRDKYINHSDRWNLQMSVNFVADLPLRIKQARLTKWEDNVKNFKHLKLKDCFAYKVKTVEVLKQVSGLVYDLTVEGDPSFAAPFAIVHNCHRCHYSGYGFPQLVKTSLPLVTPTKEVKAKDLEWQPLHWPPTGILESTVWDYLLTTRGISANVIEHFKLGWTHKIPLAVVIPLIQDGDIRALQVRFLSSQMKPKYLNYAIGDKPMVKSEMIFNIDSVIKGVSKLYIMEGVFDVMKSGIWNGVCTFGKIISSAQLVIINKIPKEKLVLSFDFDVKIKEIIESIKSLESFGTVFIKKIPEGKDPGDFDPDAFELLPEITTQEYMLGVL